jgi:phosphoglycolate phosphatase/pyrophosphatase PpaX
MRYTCLLLDHDDTAVDSTPNIHYRAHLEQMDRLGRNHEALTLEEWFKVNYSPGFLPYVEEMLKLSEEEKELCYAIWREYTTVSAPPFFPGILDFLRDYRQRGGIIVVVSHSEADVIRKHYLAQDEIPGFLPDRIIGWNGDRLMNKPFPWPVESVLEEYGLPRDKILVVDDLQPGITMAARAGVDSVAVGWSHGLEEIKTDISQKSTYYADTLSELKKIVYANGG